MSKAEKMLIHAGAKLVRSTKHKVYELDGQRFFISHGSRTHDNDLYRPILRFLKQREV